MTEQQMCLACNQRPAIPNGGTTVPLCAPCTALASGKSRGVDFQKKPEKPDAGVDTPS